MNPSERLLIRTRMCLADIDFDHAILEEIDEHLCREFQFELIEMAFNASDNHITGGKWARTAVKILWRYAEKLVDEYDYTPQSAKETFERATG